MTPEAVQQLLDKYVSEELSKEEFVALWQTLSEEEHRVLWEEKFDSLLQSDDYGEIAKKPYQQLILAGILQEGVVQAPVRKMPGRKIWWAAASVVLMLSAGAYFWFISPENKPQKARQPIIAHDLPPGKEGAILTLADGRQVVLDSMNNGHIATQNGASVVLKDNEISYAPGTASSDEIIYNTLSTPRGRQFHVLLPDGTDVWLNAASSIRYPTSFNKQERKVLITGEVYFEVAKNAAKPFVVDVDGKMDVQVLGTRFNVNAYADEPQILTTLLDGSVKVVKAGTNPVTLEPRQQASLKGQQLEMVPEADMKMVMAWKEGYFIFNFTNLEEILRQFARWYDMTVVYEKGVPDIVLSGAIRRDFTLTEALMTLEEMGLRYKLNGKQLTVLP